VLLAGRYLLVEEIERDLLGVVYRVKDNERDDREYILKMLHPALSNDADARKRFNEEVATCIDLHHPPRVLFDRLDSGRDIYYYLTGRSLGHYLGKRQGKIPLFTLDEIRVVMQSLLDTLDYAHQFTIHNHLSPATIILIDTFPEVSVRLLNFGVNDDILTYHLTGSLPATQSLAYMAPEQVKNPLATDLRADLFSVGTILYEMTTGQQAVGAFARVSDILSGHYRPLDQVLARVLSADVDKRQSSAKELSHDIAAAIDQVEASRNQLLIQQNIDGEQDVHPSQPARKSLHGARLFIAACLFGLLCLVTGGLVVFNFADQSRPLPSDEEQQALFVPNPSAPPRSGRVSSAARATATGPAASPVAVPEKTATMASANKKAPSSTGKGFAEKPEKKSVEAKRNVAISTASSGILTINTGTAGVTGHLTINVSPENARIRILNIKPIYAPAMELHPGRYHIEVSAPGYRTRTRWLSLTAGEDLRTLITLEKEAEKKPAPNTAGVELVYIKGGCYRMGQNALEKKQIIGLRGENKYSAAYSDEIPQHEVCVDDFYMGKYEITVQQWYTFIKETGYQPATKQNGCYSLTRNRWGYNRAHSWKNPGFPQSGSHPVVCVSYNDITMFLKWLSGKSDKQFRLPTEAEWEYAARAGTGDIRFWGNEINKKACRYANVAAGRNTATGNFFPCNDGYTWSSPVGSFQANSYGLYDMLGNVWEWCSDSYDSRYYARSPRNNPRGPTSKDRKIVIRGGSWNGRPSGIRSANRNWATMETMKSNLGFRVVVPAAGR